MTNGREAKLRSIALAAMLGTSTLLAGCGERSEPFALRDGCYYEGNGRPILRVRGEEGIVLTPNPAPNRAGYTYTPARRVHLRPRVDRDGTYVEVSPGFYLTDAHEAATSSPTSRFTIDTRATPPAIMVNTEAYGAIAIRLGRPC
jgi:hypothetical protein